MCVVIEARYYDPNVGRFISEDPLGFEGGDVNLYVYGKNNPILLIDPYGLFDQDWFENPNRAIHNMWMREYGNQGPSQLKEATKRSGEFYLELLFQLYGPPQVPFTILTPENVDQVNPFSPSSAEASEQAQPGK